MELGQYQLQIFVSLVVILGAAFVALICDFLKGNNERLRELTIELKVRREEDQRHSQMMTAHTIPATAPAVKERMRMERVEKARAEQRTETPVPATLAAPSPKEKQRKRPPSADALAAMERGAQLASSPRRRPSAPQREVQPAAAEFQPVQAFQNADAENDRNRMAAQTEPQTVVIPAPVKLVAHGSKKDWGTLLARRSKNMESAMEQNMEQTLDVSNTSVNEETETETVVPAGFHEGYVLSRLVQSHQPVSGLVVSIGVNTPRNEDGSMPESVRQLMESLIGAGDFACQSSSEEYLLIYPNERGASAQRRLSEIAQQLWDFQLRSMGSFSILFSWGGVEVRSESIDEAIASANERMQETRRGRKLLVMEARNEHPPLAKAV